MEAYSRTEIQNKDILPAMCDYITPCHLLRLWNGEPFFYMNLVEKYIVLTALTVADSLEQSAL